MSEESQVALRCIRKDKLPNDRCLVTFYSDAGAATIRLSVQQAQAYIEGQKYAVTMRPADSRAATG
jgi:hypothetical protein